MSQLEQVSATPKGYSPSPRPTYESPTHIPRRDVQRHIWGDRETGYVADWIYASGSKLHTIMFGLAAGRSFIHSPAFRTIFGADEVLYVASGTMSLKNPQTGEVCVVDQGEFAVFGPGTWHHATAHRGKPLRVVEFFAPPPSTGASGAYAAQQPYLDFPRGIRDDLLGQLERAGGDQTLHVVRPDDLVWRDESGLMVGLIASTPDLTCAIVEINPGLQSEPSQHGGDAVLIGLEGSFHVRAVAGDDVSAFEVEPFDGVYLPEGTEYEILSFSDCARALLGAAPCYKP